MQNRNTYEFIQSLQRNGYENITVADPSIGLSYKTHIWTIVKNIRTVYEVDWTSAHFQVTSIRRS